MVEKYIQIYTNTKPKVENIRLILGNINKDPSIFRKMTEHLFKIAIHNMKINAASQTRM